LLADDCALITNAEKIKIKKIKILFFTFLKFFKK